MSAIARKKSSRTAGPWIFLILVRLLCPRNGSRPFARQQFVGGISSIPPTTVGRGETSVNKSPNVNCVFSAMFQVFAFVDNQEFPRRLTKARMEHPMSLIDDAPVPDTSFCGRPRPTGVREHCRLLSEEPGDVLRFAASELFNLQL
jgi:hypothetical protein